jgi:uncharacterized protein YndB with AHSA1/START domain
MTQQQATTHVATEGDREIVTERVFEAPRERVFEAFVDPELIPQWWGDGWTPRRSTGWTSARAANGAS